MTGVFLIGAPVIICAKDDFYAYIDGWRGVINDFTQGYYKVDCINKDGEPVQFMIPGDELRDFKNA